MRKVFILLAFSLSLGAANLKLYLRDVVFTLFANIRLKGKGPGEIL